MIDCRLRRTPDCDGAEDGPEVNYWNTRYGLLTFKAYLQAADVDSDGIKDGEEIAEAGPVPDIAR